MSDFDFSGWTDADWDAAFEALDPDERAYVINEILNEAAADHGVPRYLLDSFLAENDSDLDRAIEGIQHYTDSLRATTQPPVDDWGEQVLSYKRAVVPREEWPVFDQYLQASEFNLPKAAAAYLQRAAALDEDGLREAVPKKWDKAFKEATAAGLLGPNARQPTKVEREFQIDRGNAPLKFKPWLAERNAYKSGIANAVDEFMEELSAKNHLAASVAQQRADAGKSEPSDEGGQ